MALKFLVRGASAVSIYVAFSDRFYSIVGISGRSMQPTFNPHLHEDSSRIVQALTMDRVLLDKRSVASHMFRRGEVVVLRSPEDPDRQIVKRLLAVEGDWIRPYHDSELVKVPKGQCWIEGDNPSISIDSNNFGPVPLALIEAKVMRVLWPPSRVGPVERQDSGGRVWSSFAFN
eukprot:GILJ01011845.1.p1 GENE.GILJ01011845.1~~GILJ01011845.1.p1  ORF type:complete len:174 (-),score=6.29 GILJ01011845.1:153-674(-)